MVALAQGIDVDSLLRAHAIPLTLDVDAASGPGYELLLDAAAEAQFFIIAEEHNLAELNRLSAHLFRDLNNRYGFRYLTLESGGVVTRWIDEAARSGGLEAVAAIVDRYPMAPTFATDEELQLMAVARELSDTPVQAVWGVDQELGALHILERLAMLAPSAAIRAELERLADEARPHEETRTGDVHYLYEIADPAAYARLAQAWDPPAGTEAARLMAALQRTVRIYTGRKDALGVYPSEALRERSMKQQFTELYRAARDAGDQRPRSLVKMGHWHTYRGIFRSDVPTFGNFLSELATFNGMESFVLSTHVVGSPDAWRNTRGLLADVGDPDRILVIDLRPLRPLVRAGRVDGLSDGTRELFFRSDALLIIGGGKTGSYSIAYRQR